jgi:hypothetical protein
MAGLQSRGLDAAICEFVQRGGLLLGICLGAQATSFPLHPHLRRDCTHICAGAAPTSAPGLRPPAPGLRPHLRRDCTHICAGIAPTSAPGPRRQHARTTGGAQVRPQSACAAQGRPGFPFERGSAARGYRGCVAQLLMSSSLEFGEHAGLGIIAGCVRPLEPPTSTTSSEGYKARQHSHYGHSGHTK